MKKIKALIVDDEPLARDLIKTYLSDIQDIELVGESENGFEALNQIQAVKPDLIFLDVQMPKINGFELLEILENPPAIIFTTAFDQYAIKAFDMSAVDYLLKPFSKERFLQSLEKARNLITMQGQQPILEGLREKIDNSQEPINRIVVRHGAKIIIIPVDSIHYFEAQDNYVMIYADKGNFLKDKSMKFYEQHLPKQDFIRIHRSFIVSVSQIESVEQYAKDTHLVILKSGTKLKTSANGYKRLREIL
ncbi:MAG: response regulator transcription factor [Bacteroidetes bacterium]|nr:response regulator transcription factor [Bacteroidota bacterium]MBL6964525.1 response regulator transcription factor [Bacteroidota bacterium]